MLSRFFAIGALVLMWVSAALAQPAGYVGHFGQQDTSIIVIADPLPHLQNLLTDPRIKRIVSGELGKALGQPGLDTQLWWNAIEGRRINIPREIVIGISQNAAADIDHMVRAGIWLGLSAGAAEAGDEAKNDLPKFQDNLAAEIRQLRIPRVRVWLAMRDANMAIGTFNLLRWQVPNIANQPGLAAEADMKRISIAADLSKLTDEADRLEILEVMGAISGDADPKAKILSDAIATLKFSATLEQKADGLLLTLGSPGDDQPLRDEDLPALMKPAPGTILSGRWDIAALKKASTGWVKLWEQSANTPAGKAAAEFDDEDLIGDLRLVARELEAAPDRGIVRLWQDKDLHLQLEEIGAPAAKPLADAKLLRALPADVQAIFLDGRQDLGRFLSGQLSDVEERMTTQWLRAWMHGEDEKVERAGDLSTAYYKHLATFRTIVHERLPELFTAPTAWLLDSRGSVGRFTAEFVDDGAAKTFSGQNLPMHQFAVVAQTTDPKKASEAIREMYAEFIKGLYAARKLDLPAGSAAMREADLGLGVPAQVFTGAWITPISPEKLKLTAEGDLVPHYFMLDDLLVFSTSPALSKRIVAAHQNGADRMDSKPLQGQVVTWAHAPGVTFAALFDHGAAWAKALAPEPAPDTQIATALAALTRLIDRMEFQTTQAGPTYTTHTRIRFARE